MTSPPAPNGVSPAGPAWLEDYFETGFVPEEDEEEEMEGWVCILLTVTPWIHVGFKRY
jgi:hypothetical protein